MTSGDPYIDPSSGILRNIPRLKTQAELCKFENGVSILRLDELAKKPIKGRFDFAHLCAIHRHVFQDVYAWAGEPRTVNTVKLDPEGRSKFTDYREIGVEAGKLFGNLEAQGFLSGLSREHFVEHGAQFFADLNTLHPFREGNGRTQKTFVEQLALHAGQELEFRIISEERMIHASIAAQKDDMEPMRHVFEDATNPEKRVWLRKATEYLKNRSFDWQKSMIAAAQEGKTYTGTIVAFSPTDMIFRQGSAIFVGRYTDLQTPGASIQRMPGSDPQWPAAPGDTFTYTVPAREHERETKTKGRPAGRSGRAKNFKDVDR